MKKFLIILFSVLLLVGCGGKNSSYSNRLADEIINEYPDLNNSTEQYSLALNKAHSIARSWIGTVPQCLDDVYFMFSQCTTLNGTFYAIFYSPLGVASKKDTTLCIGAYVLTPVDYQTAMQLTNDNSGSLIAGTKTVHSYKISGTMVNYDPADILNLFDSKDEINLGCLILGNAKITEVR